MTFVILHFNLIYTISQLLPLSCGKTSYAPLPSYHQTQALEHDSQLLFNEWMNKMDDIYT